MLRGASVRSAENQLSIGGIVRPLPAGIVNLQAHSGHLPDLGSGIKSGADGFAGHPLSALIIGVAVLDKIQRGAPRAPNPDTNIVYHNVELSARNGACKIHCAHSVLCVAVAERNNSAMNVFQVPERSGEASSGAGAGGCVSVGGQ